MFLYMYHHIADELIYHSVMSVYSIWQQYSMYIAYILHNIDHQGKNVDNVQLCIYTTHWYKYLTFQ